MIRKAYEARLEIGTAWEPVMHTNPRILLGIRCQVPPSINLCSTALACRKETQLAPEVLKLGSVSHVDYYRASQSTVSLMLRALPIVPISSAKPERLTALALASSSFLSFSSRRASFRCQSV